MPRRPRRSLPPTAGTAAYLVALAVVVALLFALSGPLQSLLAALAGYLLRIVVEHRNSGQL